MTKFDDDILRCLFSKRYMDFRTCSSLRSVSVRFYFFAAKYCLSLKELDFSDQAKAVNYQTDGLEKLYPCLVETVAKYCPNLRKIVEVCIWPKTLNSASQNSLEGLPFLTSVDVREYFMDMSIVFSFLKRLPHLQSVKVYSIDDKYGSFGDIPEEEKLAVSELSLRRGDFWRVFRVDCLKKLSGLDIGFMYETKPGEFNSAMARSQNLEQLDVTVNIHMYQSDNFALKMARVEAMPHVDHLTVNMNIFCDQDRTDALMRKFPRVWKYTKTLALRHNTGPTGYWWFPYLFYRFIMLDFRSSENVWRVALFGANLVSQVCPSTWSVEYLWFDKQVIGF